MFCKNHVESIAKIWYEKLIFSSNTVVKFCCWISHFTWRDGIYRLDRWEAPMRPHQRHHLQINRKSEPLSDASQIGSVVRASCLHNQTNRSRHELPVRSCSLGDPGGSGGSRGMRGGPPPGSSWSSAWSRSEQVISLSSSPSSVQTCNEINFRTVLQLSTWIETSKKERFNSLSSSSM